MPKGIYIYSLIATLALGFCLALFLTGKASFQNTSVAVPVSVVSISPTETPPSVFPTPTETISKNPLLTNVGWVKTSSKTIGSDSCEAGSPKVKALNAYLEGDNLAYQKQVGDFNYSVKWHENTPPEVYFGINVFYVPNTFNLTTQELLASPACGIPAKTILGATDDKIYFSQGCSGGMRPDSDSEFAKYLQYVKDCQSLTNSLSKQFSSDQNIQTIKNYYNFLSDKNLTEAYKMYSGSKKPSWSTYQTWYKDLVSARPSKFFILPGGVYRFDVELLEKPSTTTYYSVSMRVTDGKIETLSSDQLASPSDNYKNEYRAEARYSDAYKSLVLVDNKGNTKKLREYTIPESTLKNSIEGDLTTETFLDPRFSPNGQTIAYQVGGWEFHLLNMYSQKLNKSLDKDISYGKAFFSSNGQKAIVCAGGEFAGPNFLGVYDLNNLSLEKDQTSMLIPSNNLFPTCTQEGNKVKVTQTYDQDGKSSTKQFYLDF